MDLQRLMARLSKVGYCLAGLYLFILGLKLIVAGARSFEGVLRFCSVDDVAGGLGFGWLMACLVLSGSPVAATSLSLHEEGTIDRLQTFAMINGSRLGAAFVVLLIGFLYDLRGKSHTKSVYVGALTLFTTLTTYIPAMFLGFGLLKLGWLGGFHPDWGRGVEGLLDLLIRPVIDLVKDRLAAGVIVPLGVLTLLLGFKVFDRVLPDVDPTQGWLARMATVVYRPMFTLLLGMLVTGVTLSVSVSLSILVPLTAKGYVRRENLIPYIMGANITTWIDTMFASLLMKSPDAFELVLVEMVVGIIVSLPIIVFAYGIYERMIDRLATAVTRDRVRLAIFVAFFLAVPVLLLVI